MPTACCVQKLWVGHGWVMHLGPSLLSRPCNGTTVLPSGQARVGACKDSVWMHVKRVCKCTGLKKKKSNKKQKQKQKNKKLTHLHKNAKLHRPCMCHVCLRLWCRHAGRHMRVAWQ